MFDFNRLFRIVPDTGAVTEVKELPVANQPWRNPARIGRDVEPALKGWIGLAIFGGGVFLGRVALAGIICFSGWCAFGCDRERGTGENRPIGVERPLGGERLRVVSLAPNLTEVFFALESEHLLVGRTRYCDHPSRAEDIPVVSDGMQFNLEPILSADPHLILVLEGQRFKLPESLLTPRGIRVYATRMETATDILRTIRELGILLDRRTRGQELAEHISNRLGGWPQPGHEKKRVMVVYGHRPLVVAGGDSWGHELVRLLGHENVFSGVGRPHLQVDAESLLVNSPDLIVDLVGKSDPEGAEAFWSMFFQRAGSIKSGVVLAHHPALLRPGPRILEALEALEAGMASPRFPGADP